MCFDIMVAHFVMSKSNRMSELCESLRQLFKLPVEPSVVFRSERVFNDMDNIINK